MAPRSSVGSRAGSAIGSGVEVKGRVEGDEDLHIDGRLEGSVAVSGALTVSPEGLVAADISARTVDIAGSVIGDVTAAETVVLHASAKLVGNISAPRLSIADGASFKGQIDMSGEAATSRPTASARAASARTASRPESATKRDDREITVVVKHAELGRGERPAAKSEASSTRAVAPKKRAKKTVRARVPARGKTKNKTTRRG